MPRSQTLPALPEIGHPERYYVALGHEADRCRDHEAHEAFKVGLYLSRAINYLERWDEKLRCFEHALKHHCVAPVSATPAVIEFYAQLAQLVRDTAGQETLKLASRKDDQFAARLVAGEPRCNVLSDARDFFKSLIPTDHRPAWMNQADYDQLKILRAQWK